ncbi:MAG: amidohydrolase family protein, partial [Actinomycetota bacterium]
MQLDDLILVSVDDHVVEPPDLFEGRLSKRAAERAPHVVKLPNGADAWMFEGSPLPNVGLNAVAGRVPEEYGVDPLAFDQMRPGCYDIDARIDDMNVNGVLGSLNFPSLAGFTGQLFSTCDDKEIALELLQAYNDWHIEDWCGTHPGRMIPLAVPVLWDPELMAAEVRRTAEKGCHAVTFSENPTKLGHPSFHTDHWDPFWQACVETETVVCLHIGSSSETVITSADAPIDTMITLQPMHIVQCAADLVWSPLLRKFDGLRIALSEGGIGWIPYFLERIDYVYQHHHRWTNQDFGDKLPSQVFNEHVITCFIDDAVGMEIRHHLNMDNVCWECDYPHSDSTWPDAPELAWKY